VNTDNNEILLRTADMFIGVLMKFLAQDGRVHPETAISSASRMAGTFMFRSFGLNTEAMEPGQVLLTPNANEKSAHLTSLIDATLSGIGDKIDIEKAKAALDVRSISTLTLLETQERFESLFSAISKTVGLSLPQAGSAACIASALLVHKFRDKIDINRSYVTAVYGHIEALKTVPARIQVTTPPSPPQTPAVSTPGKSKPWYKLW